MSGIFLQTYRRLDQCERSAHSTFRSWDIHRVWRATQRVLAVAGFLLFLGTAFRAGWNRAETDFPNYYTAAVLVTKRAPLRSYYDWTWFQKQMNFAGIENQLGGYIPQTPLTMMPMVPLTRLSCQTAKRVWISFNLGFLIASFGLLSAVARLSMAQITLLALTGFGSLQANFLLGQYYVFLLFLLTLAIYCLKKQPGYSAGLLLGASFALKLYGGPLLLYFAARRHFRPALGMVLSIGTAVAIAALIFGWGDIAYFATHILPRALEGETLDPYNSGNGTFSTLLRRAFVAEPELNPNPLWQAAGVYFFVQPFFTVLVLSLPLLSLRECGHTLHGLAWFFIAVLLVSPNTASYTFILLLIPVVLLLENAGVKKRVALICCYALINIAVGPSWSWIFPKVWLLFALFVLAGQHTLARLEWKRVVGALVLAGIVALPVSWWRLETYRQEPGRTWPQVAVQQGAIYSSSPVILRSGIVYESIGRSHYVLRWLHDGRNQEFAFSGETFDPAAESPDGPIHFEMVTHGTSSRMTLDLRTATWTPSPFVSSHEKVPSATSPDGRWRAFLSNQTAAATQLWLEPSSGGPAVLIAGGECNNFSPAWELDSKAVVFVSDCGRGIGLPALYRAQLDALQTSSNLTRLRR